jgi:hypothetical protein
MPMPDEYLERVVDEALRRLDHQRPGISADAIMRRAATRRRRGPHLAIGALVTVAGATAVLAMPGSPVTRWIRRAITREQAPRATAPAPVPPPAVQARASAISVVPGADFELEFESPQATGEIRLRFGPQPDLSVQAEDGDPQYAVQPRGLTVRNRGLVASYLVTVPIAVRRLRIRVGGATVLDRIGERMTPALTPDSAGDFVVSISARRK